MSAIADTPEFKRSGWLGSILAINGGSGTAPKTDWENFSNHIFPTMDDSDNAKYDLGRHYAAAVGAAEEQPLRAWRNIFAEKVWVDTLEPLNQARKNGSTLDHTVFVDSHFAPTAGTNSVGQWNLGKEFSTGAWFQKGYISLVYANDLIPLSPVNTSSPNEIVKIPHIEIFGHLIPDDTSKTPTTNPAKGDVGSYDLGNKYAYWRNAFTKYAYVKADNDPTDTDPQGVIIYAKNVSNKNKLFFWDGSNGHEVGTGASSFDPGSSPSLVPDNDYNDKQGSTDISRNLGSTSKRWNNVYANIFRGIKGVIQYDAHLLPTTNRPTTSDPTPQQWDLGSPTRGWEELYAFKAYLSHLDAAETSTDAAGNPNSNTSNAGTSTNIHTVFKYNFVPSAVGSSSIGRTTTGSLGYIDAFWKHVFATQYWFRGIAANTVGVSSNVGGIIFFDSSDSQFKKKIGTVVSPLGSGGSTDLTNVTTSIVPRKTTSSLTTLLNLGASEQAGRVGDKHWGKLYIHEIRNEETTSVIQWHGHVEPTQSTSTPSEQWDLGRTDKKWNNLYAIKAHLDDIDAFITSTVNWTPDRSNTNRSNSATNKNLHVSHKGNFVPAATGSSTLGRQTTYSIGYIDAFWKHIFATQYWFRSQNTANIGTSTNVGAILFFDGSKFRQKIGTTISDFAAPDFTNIGSTVRPVAATTQGSTLDLGGADAAGKIGDRHWRTLYVHNIRNERNPSSITIHGHLLPTENTTTVPAGVAQWNLGSLSSQWSDASVRHVAADEIKVLNNTQQNRNDYAYGNPNGTAARSQNQHTRIATNLVPSASGSSKVGRIGSWSLGWTDAYYPNVFAQRYWFAKAADQNVNMKSGDAILFWDGTAFKYKTSNTGTPLSFGAPNWTAFPNSIVPDKDWDNDDRSSTTFGRNLGSSTKRWWNLYVSALRGIENTAHGDQISSYANIIPDANGTRAVGNPDNYWAASYIYDNLTYATWYRPRTSFTTRPPADWFFIWSNNGVPTVRTRTTTSYEDTPLGGGGSGNLSSVTTNIIPSQNWNDRNTSGTNLGKNLGSSTKAWKDLYVKNLYTSTTAGTHNSNPPANRIIIWTNLIPSHDWDDRTSSNRRDLGNTTRRFNTYAGTLKVDSTSTLTGQVDCGAALTTAGTITSAGRINASTGITVTNGQTITLGGVPRSTWPSGGGSGGDTPAGQASIPYSSHLPTTTGASNLDSIFGKLVGALGVSNVSSAPNNGNDVNSVVLWVRLSTKWIGVRPTAVFGGSRLATSNLTQAFAGFDRSSGDDAVVSTVLAGDTASSAVRGRVWVHEDTNDPDDGEIAILHVNSSNTASLLADDIGANYADRSADSISSNTRKGNLRIPHTSFNLFRDITSRACDSSFGRTNGSIGYNVGANNLLIKVGGFWYGWGLS